MGESHSGKLFPGSSHFQPAGCPPILRVHLRHHTDLPALESEVEHESLPGRSGGFLPAFPDLKFARFHGCPGGELKDEVLTIDRKGFPCAQVLDAHHPGALLGKGVLQGEESVGDYGSIASEIELHAGLGER